MPCVLSGHGMVVAGAGERWLVRLLLALRDTRDERLRDRVVALDGAIEALSRRIAAREKELNAIIYTLYALRLERRGDRARRGGVADKAPGAVSGVLGHPAAGTPTPPPAPASVRRLVGRVGRGARPGPLRSARRPEARAAAGAR